MARILIGFAAVVAALTLSSAVSVLASTDEPVTTDDITVDTANPFLPDDVDLTACIGTLQRPGCGSEARGGWHQNFVAIAMVGGLLIVFGRVAWSVRRGRRVATSDGLVDGDGDSDGDIASEA